MTTALTRLAAAVLAAALLQTQLQPAAAVDCTSRLVAVATSSDTTCPIDAPRHWYPVGGAPADCHGWAAKDTSGREHLNSASDFKCNADGSFTLTQHAGNLGCTGTGVDKTFHLATCEQDTPLMLWSAARDLSCCSAPGSDACAANTGTPSVARQGSTIYMNGELCDAAGAAAAPTGQAGGAGGVSAATEQGQRAQGQGQRQGDDGAAPMSADDQVMMAKCHEVLSSGTEDAALAAECEAFNSGKGGQGGSSLTTTIAASVAAVVVVAIIVAVVVHRRSKAAAKVLPVTSADVRTPPADAAWPSPPAARPRPTMMAPGTPGAAAMDPAGWKKLREDGAGSVSTVEVAVDGTKLTAQEEQVLQRGSEDVLRARLHNSLEGKQTRVISEAKRTSRLMQLHVKEKTSESLDSITREEGFISKAVGREGYQSLGDVPGPHVKLGCHGQVPLSPVRNPPPSPLPAGIPPPALNTEWEEPRNQPNAFLVTSDGVRVSVLGGARPQSSGGSGGPSH